MGAEPDLSAMLRALIQSLRPHQWTKNLVLFAALGLSKHLFEAAPLLRSLGAFLVFCGLSGTVYLINDVADVERDRLHPRKRFRPIASGTLAIRTAVFAAGLLGLASLVSAAFLARDFLVCAVLYLALNLLYSFRLKEVVIVDVLAVSLGFVLRAVAGAVAIPVQISDWLLICTILLALFLTLCKRRHELVSLSEGASEHRKILAEYSPYLLDQMIAVVTASCVTAYAFYTTAAETREKFQTDRLTWTIPFVLYGVFRYLYLVHRKEQGGSPTDVLITDRPLLLAVALWALAIVVIVYTARGVPAPVQGQQQRPQESAVGGLRGLPRGPGGAPAYGQQQQQQESAVGGSGAAQRSGGPQFNEDRTRLGSVSPPTCSTPHPLPCAYTGARRPVFS